MLGENVMGRKAAEPRGRVTVREKVGEKTLSYVQLARKIQ